MKSREELDELLKEYENLLIEKQRKEVLEDTLKEKLTTLKTKVIKEALSQNLIDLRNKDTRTQGEAEALLESEEYQETLKNLMGLKNDTNYVKMSVMKERISLTKAWLYAQAGRLRFG